MLSQTKLHATILAEIMKLDRDELMSQLYDAKVANGQLQKRIARYETNTSKAKALLDLIDIQDSEK